MDGMYAGFAGAKTGHGDMLFSWGALVRRVICLRFTHLPHPAGITNARCLLLGANTP